MRYCIFENKRRYSRPIRGPAAFVRVRRIPPRGQLPFPGGLRGPRKAIARDHLPHARLQGPFIEHGRFYESLASQATNLVKGLRM